MSIIPLDFYLFELINQSLHHPFLDTLIPFWRNKYFWSPLYLFILVFLGINYKQQLPQILLFTIATIFITDQLSSGIIKPLVNRLRPCQMESMFETLRLLVPCGSGRSFVSSHATNHFAVAVLFISLFKPLFRWVLPVGLFWAASIAYGQVYVGVHFPLDVFCGALLGGVIGLFMATWLKQYVQLHDY